MPAIKLIPDLELSIGHNVSIMFFNCCKFVWTCITFTISVELIKSLTSRRIIHQSGLIDALMLLLGVQSFCILVFIIWGPCYLYLGHLKDVGSTLKMPLLTFRYVQEAKSRHGLTTLIEKNNKDKAEDENKDRARNRNKVETRAGDWDNEAIELFQCKASDRVRNSAKKREEKREGDKGTNHTAQETAASSHNVVVFQDQVMRSIAQQAHLTNLKYPNVVTEVTLAVFVHLVAMAFFSIFPISSIHSFQRGVEVLNEMILANSTSYKNHLPLQTFSDIWDCKNIKSLPTEMTDILANTSVWIKGDNACRLHRLAVGLGIVDLLMITIESIVCLSCLVVLIWYNPRIVAWRAKRIRKQARKTCSDEEVDAAPATTMEDASDNGVGIGASVDRRY
ncbi:hypothetical protein BX616_006477 [Lobosporangium transversale]|nr:hypothetical protein BX616_006477 [Lobosporangium transversale]